VNGLRKCGVHTQWSFIKKNEIMSSVGKQMELEIMMLSERYHTLKTNIACFLSFVEVRKTQKTRSLK
jgi:hypothetical protein